MILRDQQILVERLSALATEREEQAEARRQAYRRWKQKRLSNFDSLAWIFRRRGSVGVGPAQRSNQVEHSPTGFGRSKSRSVGVAPRQEVGGERGFHQ